MVKRLIYLYIYYIKDLYIYYMDKRLIIYIYIYYMDKRLIYLYIYILYG